MHLSSSSRRRLGRLAAAFGLAGALVVPSTAMAATLTVDHNADVATYQAAPGETNNLSFYRLSNWYRIQDSALSSVGLSEIGGTLCTVMEPWKFRCPTSSVTSANVYLGDGADTLDASNSSIAVTVHAGPDAKTITTGSGADTINARNGSVDTIACGDGVDTVVADADDTVAADCEQVSRGASTDDPSNGTGTTDTPAGATGSGSGSGDSASGTVFNTPLGLHIGITKMPISNHHVRVALGCAANAANGCRGEVTMELPPGIASHVQRGKVIAARGQYVTRQRKRHKLIGRRSYRLAAGESKTIAVPVLFRGHYRYLSRKRRSRAIMRIVERDSAGKVVDVQTRSVTLTSKRGQR
jgi:hypothetical protein